METVSRRSVIQAQFLEKEPVVDQGLLGSLDTKAVIVHDAANPHVEDG